MTRASIHPSASLLPLPHPLLLLLLLLLARPTTPLSPPRPAAPSGDNLWHRDHALLMDASLRRLTGTALLPRPNASPAECSSLASNEVLCVVSHGTEEDPTFNYATAAALECFGYDWDEFVASPSRFSAEMEEREERFKLLEQASRDGFVPNYSGVRITKGGRRFRIHDAIIWNLEEREGESAPQIRGQAAMFMRSDVEWLD